MAFGLLTTKWQILWQPLQVKSKYAGKVLPCVTRLHNFCINEQEFQVDPAGPPAGHVDNDHNAMKLWHHFYLTVTNIAGNSMMRNLLLDKITNMALCRPQYNVARNVGV
jgi:hypothetical protein